MAFIRLHRFLLPKAQLRLCLNEECENAKNAKQNAKNAKQNAKNANTHEQNAKQNSKTHTPREP